MVCLRSALKVRMVVVDRFDIEQVKGYTIMPNYHQRDRTLSIKAKGILSQMFSLPEGWDYGSMWWFVLPRRESIINM